MDGTPGIDGMYFDRLPVYPARASLSTVGLKVCTQLMVPFGAMNRVGLVNPRKPDSAGRVSFCRDQAICANRRSLPVKFQSMRPDASVPSNRLPWACDWAMDTVLKIIGVSGVSWLNSAAILVAMFGSPKLLGSLN